MQYSNTCFLICRNEESLLPVDLLINQAERSELGKLVRVSAARFDNRFSVQ